MTPVRVTAKSMGFTVFQSKSCVLEWTPQGTIRVTETEPGMQPNVVLDVPPQGLKGATHYKLAQSMVVLKPQVGSALKLDLTGSTLAPEYNESADSFARRQMATGAPSAQWWADTLKGAGVKVATWGMAQTFGIAFGVVAAIIVITVIAFVLSEM